MVIHIIIGAGRIKSIINQGSFPKVIVKTGMRGGTFGKLADG
jgi:hypothetical protein